MPLLSQTAVVNLALREIGEYRINDITENSTTAEIARDLFDQARSMALEAHEWRFALKQAELATINVTPIARYDFVWQLPSDFIRLGSVSDNDKMDPELRDFIKVGRTLYSSTDFLFIEYVYDHITYSEWPAYFAHFMAAMLAAEMASPLKSTTERERLQGLLAPRLAHARSLDSQQAPTVIRRESNWLRAMRGSAGWWDQ